MFQKVNELPGIIIIDEIFRIVITDNYVNYT